MQTRRHPLMHSLMPIPNTPCPVMACPRQTPQTHHPWPDRSIYQSHGSCLGIGSLVSQVPTSRYALLAQCGAELGELGNAVCTDVCREKRRTIRGSKPMTGSLSTDDWVSLCPLPHEPPHLAQTKGQHTLLKPAWRSCPKNRAEHGTEKEKAWLFWPWGSTTIYTTSSM